MVRSRSRKTSQIGRIIMMAVIAIIILGLTFGVYLGPRQSQSAIPEKPAQQGAAATDLGITYLPLTPGVSAYYDLGVDSGALITQVTHNSLADRAGLRVGDVILSFNGAAVETGNSLLSAIRQCPVGTTIVMEVFRGKTSQTFSFVHTQD